MGRPAPRVVASERVSLYGLAIVPRRRVNHSRIAPGGAEIFAVALAMGEVRRRPAFYAAEKPRAG